MKLGTVAYITKKVLVEKLQAYYKSILEDNSEEMIDRGFLSIIPKEIVGGIKHLDTSALIKVCEEGGFGEVLFNDTVNEFPTGDITNVCVIDEETQKLYIVFDQYHVNDELIAKLI